MEFGIFLLGLVNGVFFGISLWNVMRNYNKELWDVWEKLYQHSSQIRSLENFKEKIESAEDDCK